jgi:hypothetical protein
MGKSNTFPTPWLNTSKNKNGSPNKKGSNPNIPKKIPGWNPPPKSTPHEKETPPHA